MAFHIGMKRKPDVEQVKNIAAYVNKTTRWQGKHPPDFRLDLLDGTRFELSEHVGKKIVVLNFFATWCDACREEFPELERYRRQHAGDPFLLLCIDVGEKAETVRQFVKEMKTTLPVGLDPRGEAAKLFQVESYPTTVYIDASGRIAVYEMGAIANADVTFDRMVRRDLEILARGGGVSKEGYLAGLAAQAPVAPPPEGKKDEIVLEGRALRIAQGLHCLCGCEHRLLECGCAVDKEMKKRLKELAADPRKTDREIAAALGREFCKEAKK